MITRSLKLKLQFDESLSFQVNKSLLYKTLRSKIYVNIQVVTTQKKSSSLNPFIGALRLYDSLGTRSESWKSSDESKISRLSIHLDFFSRFATSYILYNFLSKYIALFFNQDELECLGARLFEPIPMPVLLWKFQPTMEVHPIKLYFN